MIITKTPFRISFFGGGTDFPEWYNEHGGQVISTSIDKYCYISIRNLPPFFDHKYRIVYSNIENVKIINEIEHPSVRETLKFLYNKKEGLEIHHDGDLPAKSGLGSSSAFTVGLVNAIYTLNHNKIISKKNLAEQSIYIERELIKENVGIQDQIATAHGGFNNIIFNKDDSYEINPIHTNQNTIEKLSSHLLLAFTGLTRFSSEITKIHKSNIKHNEIALKELNDITLEAKKLLTSPNLDIKSFGNLLHQSWIIKKTLSNKITNQQIDNIYNTALENGAIGGKILGAGAGGFMLFVAEPKNHTFIKKALHKLLFVPFQFENTGSQVILNTLNSV